MRSEIFDYKIEYFDNEYKYIELRYVIKTRFNKEHCETTFYFISEIDENNKIKVQSITYPYVTILEQRLLLYDLVDDEIIERDDSLSLVKHSYSQNTNNIRCFMSLRRRWKR